MHQITDVDLDKNEIIKPNSHSSEVKGECPIVITDDMKHQMIASMIWESPKYNIQIKEQLLAYFSKMTI